jgi:hypothetical protein
MMARSDGARQWAIVLSELAGVPVVVELERPAWRVRWVGGRGTSAQAGASILSDDQSIPEKSGVE